MTSLGQKRKHSVKLSQLISFAGNLNLCPCHRGGASKSVDKAACEDMPAFALELS